MWCQMLLSTASASIWKHLACQKYYRQGMYLQYDVKHNSDSGDESQTEKEVWHENQKHLPT